MFILIKVSDVPEKLGLNFSISHDSIPQTSINVTNVDLLSGFIVKVPDSSTKLFITPLDVLVPASEFPINSSNSTDLLGAVTSGVLSEYRPRNEEGESLPFTQEIFPQEKIEEIEEIGVGNTILLDFLNKSISFEIVELQYDSESQETIKVALNDKTQNEEAYSGILTSPFFIFQKPSDTNLHSKLTIYIPDDGISCEVAMDESSGNFLLSERIMIDDVAALD